MTRVIAIDGPAAAGKGTIARAVAQHFGFAHLDTGALYRATARDARAVGVALDDEQAVADLAAVLDPAGLSDPALRSVEIGEAASRIATLGEVRAALMAFQRNFAASPPNGAAGAVLDGRDIATVVCPDADAKLWVTASVAARAARRRDEVAAADPDVTLSSIIAAIEARDARDAARAYAPMAAPSAGDARLLDTSALSIMEAVNQAIAMIVKQFAARGI